MYKKLNQLKALSEMLRGLTFFGTCDAGMGASTTAIVCAELAHQGDDLFNTGWSMVILRNTNSVGNAPEGQFRDITNYVSITGSFTTAAFGANVEEGDVICVMKNELADWADGGRLDLILDTLALEATVDTHDADIKAKIGAEFDGTPDQYDVEVTGYDSSAIASNEDGSILERLEWLQQNFGKAVVDADQGVSTTIIDCLDMAGFGDDYFNTGWQLCVLVNANSHGAAPEGEWRDITDYSTADGVFTCAAFSANVEANDVIMVARDEVVDQTRATHRLSFSILPVAENVANVAEVDLVAPAAITLTIPTGATKISTKIVATIYASNMAAAAHSIGLTLQDNVNAGGWVDVINLTAVPLLSLPAGIGAMGSYTIVIDTNAIVTGQTYQARWQVDSNNAGSVNYGSEFTFVLEYNFS